MFPGSPAPSATIPASARRVEVGAATAPLRLPPPTDAVGPAAADAIDPTAAVAVAALDEDEAVDDNGGPCEAAAERLGWGWGCAERGVVVVFGRAAAGCPNPMADVAGRFRRCCYACVGRDGGFQNRRQHGG